MSRKSIFDLTRCAPAGGRPTARSVRRNDIVFARSGTDPRREDYQRLEQDEEQLDRFEKARRAKLPVPRVRKVRDQQA